MTEKSGGGRVARLALAGALFLGWLACGGPLGGPEDAEGKVIKVPGGAPNVSEAVGAASAGDTVLISPGTYSREKTDETYPIFISKALTILGGGDPGACVLIPDATKRAVQYREVACFIVRDVPAPGKVIFRGLTFEKAEGGKVIGIKMKVKVPEVRGVGVEVYRAAAELEDCRFLNIATALRVSAEGRVRATGCYLEDVDMGLSSVQGDVVFEGNELRRCKNSINLEWARGTVRGNRCLQATVDGISLNHTDSVRVEENYIEGSQRAGIGLRWSSPLLSGNEVVNSEYGIWCTEKSAPRIVKNTVRGSRAYDIGCERGASPIVGGSAADANDLYGDGLYFVYNLTDFPVDCRWNFWGKDCPQAPRFTGQVRFSPWTDRTHVQEVTRCP